MEITSATNRHQEILMATKKFLEEGLSYNEINMKKISTVTSLSRPSLYNYFQTKEEIFLALLTQEYELWAEALSRLNNQFQTMNKLSYAKKLAESLEKRPLMLQLIANNLTDFEEHSRTEFIKVFKSAYGKTLRAVKNNLQQFFPEMTESDVKLFIYAFFPFLYGLNPYSVGTKKQRIGMQDAQVDFQFYSVYKLTLNLLRKLLEIKGE